MCAQEIRQAATPKIWSGQLFCFPGETFGEPLQRRGNNDPDFGGVSKQTAPLVTEWANYNEEREDVDQISDFLQNSSMGKTEQKIKQPLVCPRGQQDLDASM